MKKSVHIIVITLILVIATTNSYAIKAGTYTRLFSNGVFSVVPPIGFEDIKRKPNGAEFWNNTEKVSFSVTHVDYKRLSTKFSDEALLKRFDSQKFYQGFKHGFNSMSTRSIASHKVRKIRESNVLEIIAMDPTGKTNPIKMILFYRKGIEFRITIGAPTLTVIEDYDHLFTKIFTTLATN